MYIFIILDYLQKKKFVLKGEKLLELKYFEIWVTNVDNLQTSLSYLFITYIKRLDFKTLGLSVKQKN